MALDGSVGFALLKCETKSLRGSDVSGSCSLPLQVPARSSRTRLAVIRQQGARLLFHCLQRMDNSSIRPQCCISHSHLPALAISNIETLCLSVWATADELFSDAIGARAADRIHSRPQKQHQAENRRPIPQFLPRMLPTQRTGYPPHPRLDTFETPNMEIDRDNTPHTCRDRNHQATQLA